MAEFPDRKPLSINVRISGALRAHVEEMTTTGDYESVSEYIRDLIRRDKRAEAQRFEALKTHLQEAFSISDDECSPVTFEDVKARAMAKIASKE